MFDYVNKGRSIWGCYKTNYDKFDDVQILKKEDKLNAVCVYNIVTDKNKLIW